MAVALYDNHKTFNNPVIADIDRVYCLDWDRFGDAEWATLDRLCCELPGWPGYQDVPFWFGTDDTDIPHLFASVEPSGLQVCGVLPAADWFTWVLMFDEWIVQLLSFACD